MPDHRQTLADKAEAAWARYESTVRTGGTPDQRRWACDLAIKAETALGQYDLRNKNKADTQELDAVAGLTNKERA